MLMILY